MGLAGFRVRHDFDKEVRSAAEDAPHPQAPPGLSHVQVRRVSRSGTALGPGRSERPRCVEVRCLRFARPIVS